MLLALARAQPRRQRHCLLHTRARVVVPRRDVPNHRRAAYDDSDSEVVGLKNAEITPLRPQSGEPFRKLQTSNWVYGLSCRSSQRRWMAVWSRPKFLLSYVIQQQMQFDRTLGLTPMGPIKHAGAQLYGGANFRWDVNSPRPP
jgi:hypothetical protein